EPPQELAFAKDALTLRALLRKQVEEPCQACIHYRDLRDNGVYPETGRDSGASKLRIPKRAACMAANCRGRAGIRSVSATIARASMKFGRVSAIRRTRPRFPMTSSAKPWGLPQRDTLSASEAAPRVIPGAGRSRAPRLRQTRRSTLRPRSTGTL